MKSFIVLLCLVVSSFAFKETLMTVLKSPTNTLRLYRNFKSRQHLKFEDNKEDRRRFRKFKRSAKMVANANEHSDSAVFALNLFSTMSRAEKKQYLGLNITGHEQPHSTRFVSSGEVPAEKLWTNEGAVTEVVNQGTCGSCWTFGAVGGVETRYKNLSGKLRRFSEQEYLDCVYESQNGCNGGWPSDSYTYSKNNEGRLASAADYPYTGSVGTCQGSSKPNAAVAYKITGSVEVPPTESENIQALANKGSLTVAFEVTDYFQQYSSGILKDTTCTGSINHAVVAVGYTADYVLVKNSWGRDWGDQGFVRFARNHDNCGLFEYSYYPILTETGASDNNPSDAAVSYTPTEGSDSSEGGSDSSEGGSDSKDCKDAAVDCDSWMCEFSSLTDMMKEMCAKTCSHCSSSGGGGSCPSGTTLCSDNVCRHSHMC